ncbi:MAG: phosphoribosylformimino-5-aminoimidazole carboxamide ribotide isomerase [Lachnospiraceae bacterium]|nr:phosphoribosylformimino-5-aminoimidazole carboxamide ribotide isomerase [Lachnospiraceae bacterium]MDE6251618.1 phosphoribosylformimino-5-aminoimidazole carboxamide ribotide isomerase [Lachnospiraceae bacterium]
MRFRPCIDIHNGQVKQIVGSSINDNGDNAVENYVSEKDSAYYAEMYKRDGLTGGHIIQLNSSGSEYYDSTKKQALKALNAYEGGMQIGGGINEKNAAYFLENGATHVIVTSYVFKNGEVDYDNLKRISEAVGRKHLVLDLSCRKKDDKYYIVTDRWQKFSNVNVDEKVLNELSCYCDEFLVHAVDVEGKASGIEEELAIMLGRWDGIPITYAGGISSFDDIMKLKSYGDGRLDFTIGSALDIFGGTISYKEVVSKFV